MRQSDNYELNLVEGTDLVNPLIQDVPNYEKIDEVMKANENASVGQAVELVTGTVHAITRTWIDTPVFRFTATSNFNAGETFTVDGIQVTALLPSGETLGSGAYIIGSEVLCALRDTLMTVYTSGGTATLAQNSEKLGGELPSYYGKATDVEAASTTAGAAGVLAQSAQTGVNAINDQLMIYGTKFYFDYQDEKFGYNTDAERGADTFHPFNSDLGGELVTGTGTKKSFINLGFTPKFVMVEVQSKNIICVATKEKETYSCCYPNQYLYVADRTPIAIIITDNGFTYDDGDVTLSTFSYTAIS